ncbi:MULTISPECIES: universal stress protein [Halorussus]|uniref:universal stress protein n=1 Tax=Halorussus TaxID=1070314 RepID=UPI000E212057|nr:MULTISPECIES: universal stress protein [Halorussus]NHN61382.1 universal stress protein [Halorussus sp. JP-T4]
MYDRILVPTDGSDQSERAFEQALDLALTYDAELHLLNVVDVSALAGEFDAVTVVDSLEESGRQLTHRLRDRAEEAGVETVETLVREGVPYSTILDYADDNDVDLVVMGTHGRTGLDRYLLGSVTERVVRKSDVPVLTVRGESDRDDA